MGRAAGPVVGVGERRPSRGLSRGRPWHFRGGDVRGFHDGVRPRHGRRWQRGPLDAPPPRGRAVSAAVWAFAREESHVSAPIRSRSGGTAMALIGALLGAGGLVGGEPAGDRSPRGVELGARAMRFTSTGTAWSQHSVALEPGASQVSSTMVGFPPDLSAYSTPRSTVTRTPLPSLCRTILRHSPLLSRPSSGHVCR